MIYRIENTRQLDLNVVMDLANGYLPEERGKINNNCINLLRYYGFESGKNIFITGTLAHLLLGRISGRIEENDYKIRDFDYFITEGDFKLSENFAFMRNRGGLNGFIDFVGSRYFINNIFLTHSSCREIFISLIDGSCFTSEGYEETTKDNKLRPPAWYYGKDFSQVMGGLLDDMPKPFLLLFNNNFLLHEDMIMYLVDLLHHNYKIIGENYLKIYYKEWKPNQRELFGKILEISNNYGFPSDWMDFWEDVSREYSSDESNKYLDLFVKYENNRLGMANDTWH